MHIALESPDQPEVIALIDALDAYQRPMYPEESHHGVDIGVLTQPNVLFAVARDAQGRAVGCAAVLLMPEYGELKRMYVDPACRGQGIGQALHTTLEQEALQRGCSTLMLETGPRQPEAIALYRRLGYRSRGPYGDYWDDPHSVFMEKPLGGG
ncbi:GNAT family N-acetyltransferase [Ideonella sp. BN130291]|uniref:GNAT family N-acetyltransferase n=1 Tax=Ideonella sp. BN130291 TaxID=3112940 RepID=UPI002E265794|nr:GNAT family N-acetyltransferase [Ideonella sp. BN130291]